MSRHRVSGWPVNTPSGVPSCPIPQGGGTPTNLRTGSRFRHSPEWATNSRFGHDPVAASLDRANIARIYDCLLGDYHHFATDRRIIERIGIFPEIIGLARTNRSFLRRAICCAYQSGVRQFLDFGCGLLGVGSGYEVLRRLDPTCRVVGVDRDPLVVAQIQAGIADWVTAGVLQADLRDPDRVLQHPITRGLIDLAQPVAVLYTCVLHFVPGPASAPVRAVRQVLAPGSLLVISHATAAIPSADIRRVHSVLAASGIPVFPREPIQIRRLFTGLELLSPDPKSPRPPGLVSAYRWRADSSDPPLSDGTAARTLLTGLLAGVGRIPQSVTREMMR